MVDAPPAPAARPRLRALDGLRLIAALAVAWFHYAAAWRIDGHSVPGAHLPVASNIAIYGFLGVELFFMISGFVICMSSWGRRLGDFFTSRVSRLYPAYWVCVLITAAVVRTVPISGGMPKQGTPSAQQILTNLTMLQKPLGVAHVDTVYWTLYAELRFYLLFAVLVGFGLTYRRTVAFCAIWLTAAIFAPAAKFPLLDLVAQPDFAPYFIAGILFYLVHRFGGNPLLYAMLTFTWMICMQRVSDRLGEASAPGFPVPAIMPGKLILTGLFLVLLLIAQGRASRINWTWLTVAGALSYPFYLLHPRIGYTLMRIGYQRTEIPVWALVLLTMLLILALAWLVHRYAERPLIPVLRRAVIRGLDSVRTGDRIPPRRSTAEPDDLSRVVRHDVPVQAGSALRR